VGKYTHVYLHDAYRSGDQSMGLHIMGYNSSTYLGDTRPYKGLKHWRHPGRGRVSLRDIPSSIANFSDFK
jgi:hypothetical protein